MGHFGFAVAGQVCGVLCLVIVRATYWLLVEPAMLVDILQAYGGRVCLH